MFTIKYMLRGFNARKVFLLIPVSVPLVSGYMFYMKQNIDDLFLKEININDYIYFSKVPNNFFDSNQTDGVTSSQQKINHHQLPLADFDDLAALKLSQSSDLAKIINLALKPQVRIDSFRSPLKTEKILIRNNEGIHHFELDELLNHLLKCVHTTNIEEQSKYAKFLTEQALNIFGNDVYLSDIFFTTDYERKTLDNFHIKRYRELYFQTILENLYSSKKHVQCLLENGLLILLHKLRETFPEKQVQHWIAACLSALSIHEESHSHLFHTGWIGILTKWFNSPDLCLSLEAGKILQNLSGHVSLNRSLYVLHPLHLSKLEELECDIIFVHGLKGGVFKTWRQSDSMKHSPEYTDCWPKIWLAKDFPKCRILAVNYQTFLSNWKINDGQAYTLKEKSLQLINELEGANVGKRPIIWITHSMGGLLVKEMLSQIDKTLQNNPILDQTKGIVFYSVPHKGSEMAVWSPNMERIISPSSHVLELRKDSPTLLDLNKNFLDLATRQKIECLSFAESKSSTLFRSFIELKYLLVPEESANLGVGQFIVLPEDHFHICKPMDKSSKSYKELKVFLSKLVKNKLI